MPAKKTSRKAMKSTTKGTKAKKTTRAPRKQKEQMPEVEGHSLVKGAVYQPVKDADAGAKP